MARNTRSVLALALSVALALGTIPVPALAEMAEEAMDAETISATRPSNDPAPTAVPAKEAGQAEVQMGEEPVVPQEDSALPADPDPALPDATDFAAQSTVASGTWGTCPWDLDSQGNLTVHPGTGAEPTQMTIEISPWADHKDQIKTARFMQEGSRKVVLPQYSFAFFAHLSNLTYVDLSGADSSNTTTFSWVFCGCSSLTTIDGLSALDVSKVEFMTGLFYGCSSLTSLPGVSGWTCAKLQWANDMFAECSSLVTLDLSGWNTSVTKSMFQMFCECSSLVSLDISGLNTSATTDARCMFLQCPSLSRITVGAGYTINYDQMFPDATGYDKWWSTKDSRWFTKGEIVSSRSGVADTYVFRAGFPDVVPGAWYEGVVSRAAGLGLMSGYPNGKFGPDDNITRGQVAVVLWKMAGQQGAGAGARDFPDVRADDYFRDAVRWASGVGVVNGYANGNFGPNDNVTREQLAAMLANYARNVARRQVGGSVDDCAGMEDKAEVSEWAREAVGWCFGNGIISGAGTYIQPQGNATRAQAAKMVVVLHDLIG